jgi:hypothetical protein
MVTRVEYFPGIVQMFHPKNKSLFSQVTRYFPQKPEVAYKAYKSGFDYSFDQHENPNLKLPEPDETYIKYI